LESINSSPEERENPLLPNPIAPYCSPSQFLSPYFNFGYHMNPLPEQGNSASTSLTADFSPTNANAALLLDFQVDDSGILISSLSPELNADPIPTYQSRKPAWLNKAEKEMKELKEVWEPSVLSEHIVEEAFMGLPEINGHSDDKVTRYLNELRAVNFNRNCPVPWAYLIGHIAMCYTLLKGSNWNITDIIGLTDYQLSPCKRVYGWIYNNGFKWLCRINISLTKFSCLIAKYKTEPEAVNHIFCTLCSKYDLPNQRCLTDILDNRIKALKGDTTNGHSSSMPSQTSSGLAATAIPNLNDGGSIPFSNPNILDWNSAGFQNLDVFNQTFHLNETQAVSSENLSNVYLNEYVNIQQNYSSQYPNNAGQSNNEDVELLGIFG